MDEFHSSCLRSLLSVASGLLTVGQIVDSWMCPAEKGVHRTLV